MLKIIIDIDLKLLALLLYNCIHTCLSRHIFIMKTYLATTILVNVQSLYEEKLTTMPKSRNR